MLDLTELVPQDIHVLDVIELVMLSHDLPKLRQRLQKHKKDHYQQNERIVILHSDTEFYFHDHPTGFDTHNLFTIIKELDIPLFVILIVVNKVGYLPAVEPFVVDSADRPTVINPLIDQMAYDSLAFRGWLQEPEEKNISMAMLALLGVQRSQRIKFFQFVKHAQLEGSVGVAFSNHKAVLSSTAVDIKLDVTQGVVSSVPNRISDVWLKKSRHPLLEILDQYPVQPVVHPLINNSQSCEFYKHFAIDLVSETAFAYPYVNATEKTFRPILFKTPFVMLAAPGALARLRSYGLKTFDQYWDESYDQIQDHQLRFVAVCELVQSLCSKPVAELKQMLYTMKDLLEYNRSTLLEIIQQETVPLFRKLKVRIIT